MPILYKTHWRRELKTWSHKINRVDSPYYFYRKCAGTKIENLHFYFRVFKGLTLLMQDKVFFCSNCLIRIVSISKRAKKKFSRFFCAHRRLLQSISTAKDLKKSLIGDGRIWSASYKQGNTFNFALLINRRRTGAEMCPQSILGSFLETRWSAIGYFLPCDH